MITTAATRTRRQSLPSTARQHCPSISLRESWKPIIVDSVGVLALVALWLCLYFLL